MYVIETRGDQCLIGNIPNDPRREWRSWRDMAPIVRANPDMVIHLGEEPGVSLVSLAEFEAAILS